MPNILLYEHEMFNKIVNLFPISFVLLLMSIIAAPGIMLIDIIFDVFSWEPTVMLMITVLIDISMFLLIVGLPFDLYYIIKEKKWC